MFFYNSVLSHVNKCFVVVKPEVMIRNTHFVKSHFFRVFEKAIRSPYIVEPTDIKYAIFLSHVFGKTQAVVSPALCEENISYICLKREALIESKECSFLFSI